MGDPRKWPGACRWTILGEMQLKRTDGAMRLLIIDDEANIRRMTAVALEGMGCETIGAGNRAEALKEMETGAFDVVFLDLKLDGESGLDLLPELLKLAPELQVVVFTAYASVETAVEAMRRGAVDYVAKPFTPEQIRRVLGKLGEAEKLRRRVAELEWQLSTDTPATELTSAEPAMQKILELVSKAAATSATVVFLGESGTGKTVLARALHSQSPQKENAFVTVHCPSLSRELLESELFGHAKGAFTGAASDTSGKVALADGGTLFLDEIGELPIEIQPKLLRLLQEKEYERVGEARTRRANVRVIAATNRDLEQAVAAGRFREDLFYRLNVISIVVPSLRERVADLLPIAGSYLRFFTDQCGKHLRGFTPNAEQALLRYAWPGNLRELRNIVERAVILANDKEIHLADLPEKLCSAASEALPAGVQVGARVSLEELEQAHIARIVEQTSTVEEAARILDIDPATLYRRRKKLAA
jgi:two-component system, NtrC family, response regulator AlgB